MRAREERLGSRSTKGPGEIPFSFFFFFFFFFFFSLSVKYTWLAMLLLLLASCAPVAYALFGFGAKEYPTPEPLPRHLQGVPPGQAERYSAQEFTCGAKTIAQALVNDNYCDCEDGSDEPGTPACARGRFYCPNVGFQGKLIPSGLVWDGVCDCCDGTDEAAAPGGGVRCKNTCEADGASWRAAQEEAARSAAAGLRAKKPMLEAAAEAVRTRARDLAAAQERLAGARRAREAAEAAEAPLAAAEAAATELAREAARGVVVEALEKAFGSAALDRLALMQVIVGSAHDSTSTAWVLEHVGGSIARGEHPGVPQDFKPSWPPEETTGGTELPGSKIMIAEALGIHTLERGALLKLAHAHAKGAGATAQLLDNLRARGAVNPEWVESPDAVATLETPEGAAARKVLEGAKGEESAAQGEVSRLEGEGSTDFGPGGVFWGLKGQCFDLRFQQYTYSVCPFGSAKQDGTSLGTYSGWGEREGGGKDYKKMLFTSGAHCWNGPSRSIRVAFECGEDTKLLAVE
jgi:protein kinase C substrate 80K-H